MIEDQANTKKDIEKINPLILSVVTQKHNEIMIKARDTQQVEEAMHQMMLGKVPSPDGFMTNFFHYFWDLIKQEVWEIVEEYE